ncbi:MAG: OmpH family outer membrane protein [Chitinophagaceae bacterium]|nr:OmpH family outer membrane protein [Chitinophagaceae bacterium]
MKNGMLIWNVVLSVVAGVLLFLQFGTKKKTGSPDRSTYGADSLTDKQFRIAYFEMDSVENNFNVVKDVKTEIAAKENEYTNNVNRLDDIYRKKYNDLNSKAEGMTDQEKMAAQNELLQLGESLKGQKQDLDQKIQDFIMRKNLDVKKKIEDYLKEYNKNKSYSYIISYEQGLFYFKDTAYNITADLIRGLNDYYKQVKK